MSQITSAVALMRPNTIDKQNKKKFIFVFFCCHMQYNHNRKKKWNTVEIRIWKNKHKTSKTRKRDEKTLTEKSLSKGQRIDKKLVDGLLPLLSLEIPSLPSVIWEGIWKSPSGSAESARKLFLWDFKFPVIDILGGNPEDFRVETVVRMLLDDKQPWIFGEEGGGIEREVAEWEQAPDNIVMFHKWLWPFALPSPPSYAGPINSYVSNPKKVY